jgi:hypothetical protein
MLQTADWLHLVLYCTIISLQNIIILHRTLNSVLEIFIWKYKWGLAKSFLGIHKWKIVCSGLNTCELFASQINDADEQLILTIENKSLLPLWLTGWQAAINNSESCYLAGLIDLHPQLIAWLITVYPQLMVWLTRIPPTDLSIEVVGFFKNMWC